MQTISNQAAGVWQSIRSRVVIISNQLAADQSGSAYDLQPGRSLLGFQSQPSKIRLFRVVAACVFACCMIFAQAMAINMLKTWTEVLDKEYVQKMQEAINLLQGVKDVRGCRSLFGKEPHERYQCNCGTFTAITVHYSKSSSIVVSFRFSLSISAT